MTVVVISKNILDVETLKNVSNIAYNASTKVATVTISGQSGTRTFNLDDYALQIM